MIHNHKVADINLAIVFIRQKNQSLIASSLRESCNSLAREKKSNWIEMKGNFTVLLVFGISVIRFL